MWMKVGLAFEFVLGLLGHVDDGAADPTLAELGGRKQEQYRFLSEHVRVVDLVLRVRRDPRRDFREVAADALRGRRVDQRRLLPGLGICVEFADDRRSAAGFAASSPPSLISAADPLLAVAREVELGRVDDARDVGSSVVVLPWKARLRRQRFDPRRERADRRFWSSALFCGLRRRPLAARFRLCPARPPAPSRSRARLRRRRSPAFGRAVLFRRRRTGSGSRPGRRPSPPASIFSSAGCRPLRATSAQVLPFGRGKALFGGAGRLSPLSASGLTWASVRSRRRSRPASSDRPRAGRRGHGASRAGAHRRHVFRVRCSACPRRRAAERRGRKRDGGASGIDHGGVRRDRPGDRARCWRGGLRADALGAPAGETRGRGRRTCASDGYEVETVAANMADEDGAESGLRRPRGALRPARRAGQQRRGRDRRADGRDPDQIPRHAARRSTCAR